MISLAGSAGSVTLVDQGAQQAIDEQMDDALYRVDSDEGDSGQGPQVRLKLPVVLSFFFLITFVLKVVYSIRSVPVGQVC